MYKQLMDIKYIMQGAKQLGGVVGVFPLPRYRLFALGGFNSCNFVHTSMGNLGLRFMYLDKIL